PLFWWLRRQLRLCQDYLADDRAAALASPEDYASFLVAVARRHRTTSLVPALGVIDQCSNLTRRVAMLVADHAPLEQRCRMLWTLTVAALALIVVVGLSGLRLDAAAPPSSPQEPAPVKKESKEKLQPDAPKAEALHYSGKVKEHGTGKPIIGATVVV